jgi:hypothetical protein
MLIIAVEVHRDGPTLRQLHRGPPPNHQPHWALVELVELSSADQLREWITASSASVNATRPVGGWR